MLSLVFCLFLCNAAFSLSPLRIQKNRVRFKKLEVTSPVSSFTSDVKYFDQKRDHFSKEDSALWKQAYVIVDHFYKPGGPVYFELGGEGPMDDVISTRNLAYNLTKMYNGLMVSMEHRYYGSNRSIPVDELTVPNLKYLTFKQALADYANFIVNHNLTDSSGSPLLSNNTKWITFGGSYSGALSAWMRLKYPELVFAAHSSSAPVLAEVDFWHYGYAVDKGLPKIKGGSQLCADNWSRAVAAFDDLVATSSNLTEVKSMFGVYDDLDIRDLAAFSTMFSGDVQYGRDGDTEIGLIDKTCNGTQFPSFASPNASDAQLLSEYAALIKQEYPNATMVAKGLDSRNLSTKIENNLWGWQYCNEFGYLQTGSNSTRPFFSRLVTVDYYEWQCSLMFGGLQRFLPDAAAINQEYFGLDLMNRVSNVVFTNGDIDPWHWLGINPDTSDVSAIGNNNTVIFIKNGHHCSDYGAPSNKSSPFAVSAYQRIIQSWNVLLSE